ncbi:MAG: VanZ family protein [Bacteroidota bacterium]
MKNVKIMWFLPAIGVALAILLLSTLFAFPIQVQNVAHVDKWQHTLAYLVLSCTFLFAFWKNRTLKSSLSLRIVATCALYGLALEWAQYSFFEYRLFEWADALANMLGAVLGLFVFRLVKRFIGE